MIKKGELKKFDLGGEYRIKREEVERIESGVK
jgi:hypothetical protein